MFHSAEVAILQHSTGVMQLSWDYFENGIAFFTPGSLQVVDHV